MESFWARLKRDTAFISQTVARTDIFAYLEGWYNRRRLHSALGYLSPEQFEHQFLEDKLSLYSEG